MILKTEETVKSDSRRKRFIKKLISPLLAIVITWLLSHVFLLIMIVPTESMEPAIKAQSLCFGLRTAYWFDRPERGDLVVFRHKESGVLMVKRLIGLPGDRIELKGQKLLLNGKEYPEPYVKEAAEYRDAVFEVPEGHFLFLGDNRNASCDARYWKNPYIPADDLIAKTLTGLSVR